MSGAFRGGVGRKTWRWWARAAGGALRRCGVARRYGDRLIGPRCDALQRVSGAYEPRRGTKDVAVVGPRSRRGAEALWRPAAR